MVDAEFFIHHWFPQNAQENRLWLGGQVSRSGVYMQYMSTAEYRSQQRHKRF